MGSKLGTIPVEVSLRVERALSRPGAVYEIVCLTRFTGFDKFNIGVDSTTASTGNRTVVGEVTLVEGTIGHEKVIAAALDAARLNLKRIENDRVFHMANISGTLHHILLD